MKLKTFPLSKEAEANDFIQSVVLMQEGSIQVTSNNEIVIFYQETKEDYQTHFVDNMIESLKRNLFHEQVRKASLDLEVEIYKEKGGKSDDFDSAIKRQKEARDNINLFEAKIKGLESWTKSNTSNK